MQYRLLPNKPRNGSDCPYVKWSNTFNEDEINRILEYASNLDKTDGAVGLGSNGGINSDIRKSIVSWIHNVETTEWIWDRMAYIMRDVCSHWYGYNLTGYMDAIQYSEYHTDTGTNGHYDWHTDSLGDNVDLQRKLSMSILLSDPSEYEGGELQLMMGKNPTLCEQEKGIGIIFPSFRLHRVTPVTRGVRKSLVLWASGPSFV